jgi:hypothetical protein
MQKPIFNLTLDEAREIRIWRIAGCSWRRIAEKASEKWPDKEIIHGHQLDGIELCGESALLFNEEPSEEPWN